MSKTTLLQYVWYDYIPGTTNRYVLNGSKPYCLRYKEFLKNSHVRYQNRKKNTLLLCNNTHSGPETSSLRKPPLGLSFKYTFYKQGERE